MLEELRWKTSVSATCLHAAVCRAEGIPAADAQLAAAMDGPADALAAEITAAGWPAPKLVHELAGLAEEIDNNRELVTRAVARLHLPVGNQTALVRVAGAIADLEAAMNRAQPQLAEELAVRVRPLREQWEARGPGMLREVARLTEEAVVPATAEIALVAPYAGGHGMAHVTQNRAIFEALLVNPVPELPETMRLAWLLCQLNADLPRFADVLPAERGAAIFKLAMIPPVLAAAEAVELSKCDEAAIALALEKWRISASLPPSAAASMWSWWNAWLDAPATWPVAVAALEQMLA